MLAHEHTCNASERCRKEIFCAMSCEKAGYRQGFFHFLFSSLLIKYKFERLRLKHSIK